VRTHGGVSTTLALTQAQRDRARFDTAVEISIGLMCAQVGDDRTIAEIVWH
jgi:hypothetical protein